MRNYYTLLLALVIGIAIPLVNASANPNCVAQCQSNYTYPAQPAQPCCGCCGDPTNCHSIPEFTTCCTSNQDFCGCLSYRAFCSGNVYNNTYPSESAFGTCYPKGYGTCTYSPTPNVWVVCPTGLTGCVGNSGGSCCRSDQTCDTNYGICVSNTPAPPTDCGCTISGDQCCHDSATGKRCYNPNLYACTTNDAGQSVLCSNGYSSCGNACYQPSQYCCQNGQLQQPGTCSNQPSQSQPQSSSQTPTSATQNPTQPSSSPTDCGCVVSGDHCCHDNATGKRCYNPNLYACTTNDAGQSVLCSSGYSSCGNACYLSSQYCCRNSQLQPAGSC